MQASWYSAAKQRVLARSEWFLCFHALVRRPNPILCRILKKTFLPPVQHEHSFLSYYCKEFSTTLDSFFFSFPSIEGYDFPLYHQQIRMVDDYARFLSCFFEFPFFPEACRGFLLFLYLLPILMVLHCLLLIHYSTVLFHLREKDANWMFSVLLIVYTVNVHGFLFHYEWCSPSFHLSLSIVCWFVKSPKWNLCTLLAT